MKFFKFTLLLLLGSTLFFSCKKRGCSDPEALNFDSNATKDDHSCYYFWVGQNYGGGRVFYIDQTGKHGLISADFYLTPSGLPWGCGGENITGADNTAVGSGLANTLDIVASCGTGTAAFACNELDTLGYSDWYLPSMEEMRGLSESLGKIGQANFTGAYHITSSEIDQNNIWTVYGPNSAVVQIDKSTLGYVRPIRSF